MGKRSREKGAEHERETATALRVVWPNARRGLAQARNAREQPDVDGTPYWIECKVGKRVNIIAAMRQAEAARVDEIVLRAPIVVSRLDKEKSLVTMRLEDFLDLSTKAARADAVVGEAIVSVPRRPPSGPLDAPPSSASVLECERGTPGCAGKGEKHACSSKS